MSHGEVHEDYQEKDRNEKPSFELRRFMVLQSFLFRFQPGHTGRGSIHGFGTIACLFHRLHHIAGRSLPFYGHGIGQKRHCHFVYSRHPAHRFFHMSLAGSTGHAGHHVLAFIFTHKITIFLLRIKTKDKDKDKGKSYFITFCSMLQSSSTLSSFPSRMSSVTHPRIWAARRSLLKLFSALVTADTCITISGQ